MPYQMSTDKSTNSTLVAPAPNQAALLSAIVEERPRQASLAWRASCKKMRKVVMGCSWIIVKRHCEKTRWIFQIMFPISQEALMKMCRVSRQ